jgi:hypothetical protein
MLKSRKDKGSINSSNQPEEDAKRSFFVSLTLDIVFVLLRGALIIGLLILVA